MLEIFKVQMRHLRDLMGDRKGITAMEYAVLAVGIVAAVATAAATLGTDISTAFVTIGGYISGVTMP